MRRIQRLIAAQYYLNQVGRIAYSKVYILANELNPTLSPPRSRLPASQLSGLSAFGAPNNAMTARHTVAMPQAGDQSDLRMSRHTSPVTASTLGWKIFVTNLSFGGVSG